MNPIGRPIAWIAALQVFAVLLGHTAGLLARSWWMRVFDNERLPFVAGFYVHWGLSLLAVPIVWLSTYLFRQNASSPNVTMWVLTGIIILAAIGTTALLALIEPIVVLTR